MVCGGRSRIVGSLLLRSVILFVRQEIWKLELLKSLFNASAPNAGHLRSLADNARRKIIAVIGNIHLPRFESWIL